MTRILMKRSVRTASRIIDVDMEHVGGIWGVWNLWNDNANQITCRQLTSRVLIQETSDTTQKQGFSWTHINFAS